MKLFGISIELDLTLPDGVLNLRFCYPDAIESFFVRLVERLPPIMDLEVVPGFSNFNSSLDWVTLYLVLPELFKGLSIGVKDII